MPRTVERKELSDLYAKFDRDVTKRTRWDRFILVLDQTLNVLWLNGSQDETVSSHIGRTGKHKWLCNILKKFESNHCYKSRGE